MASYITANEAYTYLGQHGLDYLPDLGSLELASNALDDAGPFRGLRYAGSTQVRAFPRTYTVAGDTAGQVPDRVKRWVALESYRLGTNDEPPITSISLTSAGSVTYAAPKAPKAGRLQKNLLTPYLSRTPGVINSASVVRG